MELLALILSTFSLSIIHTASGPDHYLPFIFLSKSNKWSLSATVFWTFICGVGHILSSILLGLFGSFIGWQLSKFESIQAIQGTIAGWSLFALGMFFIIWGLLKLKKNVPHKHFDILGEDEMYVYKHSHKNPTSPVKRVRITPWILFGIFVMGPSEPLVPLLFFSGTEMSFNEIFIIIATFTITTISTMILLVTLGVFGSRMFNLDFLYKYTYLITGFIISSCALGMLFFNF